MGWLDDLGSRIQQASENIINDVGDYFTERVVDPVVKVGEPQRGNLSAAQIAAGEYGGAPVGAPARASASQLQNAAQASQIGNQFAKYLPLIAIGMVGFLIFRSKKG